jgi:hypothetical protein
MFEQETYQTPPPARTAQQGDLFYNYEIKNWVFTPRLYKIIGISALANILAIAFMGQTDILTRRGCESPFVGRVCQVLDTVYVGSVLFGTEREYVDAEYEKIDLKDADITYIDVSGETPPLAYPEGYFQIANPVQYAMLRQQAQNPAGFNPTTPGFTPGPSTGSGLIGTPAQTPPPNSSALKGAEPDSPFAVAGDKVAGTGPRKGRRGGRPVDPNANKEKPADVDDTAEANNDASETLQKTDPMAEVEINKKPMTDFADAVLVKWSSNQIDLNQPFTVALDAVLAKDGKLDPKRSRWDITKEQGDAKMIEIAKQSIEALSQSGWFAYLTRFDVDRFSMVLVQDENQINAIITSPQKTPERAATVSSGLNGWISIGKLRYTQPGDELTLLNGANVTAEGKNFVLKFVIPKPVAQEMINRKLKEAQAKKAQQQQPSGSGNAEHGASENTARK